MTYQKPSSLLLTVQQLPLDDRTDNALDRAGIVYVAEALALGKNLSSVSGLGGSSRRKLEKAIDDLGLQPSEKEVVSLIKAERERGSSYYHFSIGGISRTSDREVYLVNLASVIREKTARLEHKREEYPSALLREVADLPFSTRAQTVMDKANIKYVAEILAVGSRGLGRVSGYGDDTRKDIHDVMSGLGLELGEGASVRFISAVGHKFDGSCAYTFSIDSIAKWDNGPQYAKALTAAVTGKPVLTIKEEPSAEAVPLMLRSPQDVLYPWMGKRMEKGLDNTGATHLAELMSIDSADLLRVPDIGPRTLSTIRSAYDQLNWLPGERKALPAIEVFPYGSCVPAFDFKINGVMKSLFPEEYAATLSEAIWDKFNARPAEPEPELTLPLVAEPASEAQEPMQPESLSIADALLQPLEDGLGLRTRN